jgi:Heparinase II/III-like protein
VDVKRAAVTRAAAIVAVAAAFAGAALVWKRRHHDAHAAAAAAPARVAVEARPPRAGHPRVLLDDALVTRLRAAAHAGTPAWRRVRANCDRALAETLRSGYEAFDWTDAMADLALCARATGERRYATGAVRYFTALLDDRYVVGDGAGGAHVVEHDSGYPIRSFAAFVALGYDWLYDELTPAERERAVSRLRGWLAWYGEKGYQREHAIANYFCGYLMAETFAGLAVHGHAPDGERWLAHARDVLLGERLLPELARSLGGGDWPEGWQYGELSAAEVALVVEALRTATGTELRVPWLRDVVSHHLHALVPSGKAVYDGGDWSEHPAAPSPLALTAIAYALDGTRDPHGGEHAAANTERAAEARWLVAHASPPWGRERAWLALLAERPGAPELDPRAGARTHYRAAGSGLVFLRSDFGARAVWASFQAGPTLADHQHNDQGHFELWRGGDALVVDGGGYGSAATMSHNTLLVDDGGRALNYPPNQGVWGRATRIARFDDDGRAAVVRAELTDAWAPACAEDGCRKRAVDEVVRTLVYARPGVLVIDDRVRVTEAATGVAWAAHFTAAPELRGASASVRAGASRATVVTLLPDGARATVKTEPTATGEGPYRQNTPWGPMWRLEVASPTGERARRFLHVVIASGAAEPAPAVERIGGAGGGGGAIDGARVGATAVLFATGGGGGEIDVPPGVTDVIVAGDGIRVTRADGCRVTVAADAADTASPLAHVATPACRR